MIFSEESLSIEETNKLRAKLGLAPLDLEADKNTEPVEKEDGSGEKVLKIWESLEFTFTICKSEGATRDIFNHAHLRSKALGLGFWVVDFL